MLLRYDSKTAPRFIKYTLMHAVQQQEDTTHTVILALFINVNLLSSWL